MTFATGQKSFRKTHLFRYHANGFTLIELLVVIAILSLLAAILFPVFSRARENARRSNCGSNMKQVGLALLQYNQDYDERMPPYSTTGEETLTLAKAAGYTGADADWRAFVWPDLINPYVKSIQILHCPSHRYTSNIGTIAVVSYSYSKNVADDGRKISVIPLPAQTPVFIECRGSLSTQYSPTFAVAGGGTVEGHRIKTLTNLNDGWNAGVADGNLAYQRHFEGCNYLFVDGHVKYFINLTGNMPYRRGFDYNVNGVVGTGATLD